MEFLVRVKGKYASFNNFVFKPDRESYPVITPSAARGIFESIYWHPGVKYIVDKIYVLKPFSFYTFKTNETSTLAPRSTFERLGRQSFQMTEKHYIDTHKTIQQRTMNILQDVDYIIKVHIEMDENTKDPTNNIIKANNIFSRRLRKGQCWCQPYLGAREFPADVELFEGEITPDMLAYNDRVKNLGNIMYGILFEKDEKGNELPGTTLFYNAVLDHGVINLEDCEVFSRHVVFSRKAV